MRIIDQKNWKRKEHFEFFRQYDDPFFGLVSELDCTIAHKITKKENLSFFAYYLHHSCTAVNQVAELRTRIEGENIVEHDIINASPTIGREDGTFGFSYVNYDSDFSVFNHNLKLEIERVQNSSGLSMTSSEERNDVVHYSSVPWFVFTGLSHARNYKTNDSIPKITFGKSFFRNRREILPVSVHAHHGLVDGLHIARYLAAFQDLLNN